MKKKKQRLIVDLIWIIVSVIFAIIISRYGILERIIISLDGYKYLGVFVSGIFFSSVFTTAPSIVALGEFAKDISLLNLALLGGSGAVIGDFILFHFIKDRISDDVAYLVSISREKRLIAIFKTGLFRFFVPFLGALIIASPFPDEIGIAMLGMSKMRDKVFLPISFLMNTLGIFAIGWLSTAI